MLARSHHAECPKCGFEFSGGHSHHTSSEWFLCLSCLQTFELITNNPFGPVPNELVSLARLTFRKHKSRRTTRTSDDTGMKAIAVAGEARTDGKYTWREMSYDLGDFVCDCGSNGFEFEFTDGDACPKCKSSKLVVHDVIY